VAPSDRTVTVVVPTSGRASSLRRTLAALAAQEGVPAPWELVVVDNRAGDEEPLAPLVDGFPVPATVVRERRPGASHARNAGLAAAGDVVVFVDDDVAPAPGCVAALTAPVLDGAAELTGGRVELDPAVPRPRWLGTGMEGFLSAHDRGDHRLTVDEPDYVLTAAAAGDTAFLRGVGGFDPALGPRPGVQLTDDDVDLCRRVRAAGGRVVYVPEALAVHALPADRLRAGYLLRRAYAQGRSDWLLDRDALSRAPGRGAGRVLTRLRQELGTHRLRRPLDASVLARVACDVARAAGFLAEATAPSPAPVPVPPVAPVPASRDGRVAVVVPTYRRPERLARLVAALEAQTRRPDEVVVVDDGSGDDTLRQLRELAEATPLELRVLSVPHTGPALARNAGWRATATEFVAFTDDDCVPAPRWLEAGLEAIAADPTLGSVQGRTAPHPGVVVRPWATTREVDGPSMLFEACNLVCRRAALDQGGGFDEELNWFGEDTVCGWRMLDAGWRHAFAGDALVHHDITYPGFRYHLRQGFLEGHLVDLARRHPGIRQAVFWRPWCFRPRNAAFLAAVAGLVGARRWPPLALAAAPYLWDRRPRSPSRDGARLFAGQLAFDAAVEAGMITGSIRNRRLVL
jgi:glycosyltransferase involved in cell wall biosynthesis